jgi:hypothetical protein
MGPVEVEALSERVAVRIEMWATKKKLEKLPPLPNEKRKPIMHGFQVVDT